MLGPLARSKLFPYTTLFRSALVQALREKRIGGAALDVFASEPLSPSSELYSLPNVLLSPHCCDLTLNYYESTASARSEEHTSELQSQSNLVCRLLLEKKKLN